MTVLTILSSPGTEIPSLITDLGERDGIELRVAEASNLSQELPGTDVLLMWDFFSTALKDAYGSADRLRWVHAAAAGADVVVMAAAVADFRPASYASTKIKKTHADEADGSADASAPVLTLVRNPDILAELVERRGGAGSPVVVGFAAETGDAQGSVLDHGRAKLERKGCDVLVVNEVGADRTFGADDNTVTILRRGSDETLEVGPVSKAAVSDAVWDVVTTLL